MNTSEKILNTAFGAKFKNSVWSSLKFGDPKKPSRHICIESFGKKQYCVVPNSVKAKSYCTLIPERAYIKKFGLIPQIALSALLSQKKSIISGIGRRGTTCGRPALLLCPFERTGSTWIANPVEYFAKRYTEPFRQHVGLKNPVCPVDAYCEDIDYNIYNPKFNNKKYFQFWLSNLYAGFFSVPKVQIIKETNLFFTLGFVLKLLPADTLIVLLVRDIRGILSSFRKRNFYQEWNYDLRFKQIKKMVLNKPKLKKRYGEVIVETDENSWIDCLLGLYVISVSEIQEHLLSKYPAKQVMLVRYEDLVKKSRIKILDLYKHLGVSDKDLPEVKKVIKQQLSLNKGVGKFNIYKTKNPVDWSKNFTTAEHEYIKLRVDKRLEQIRSKHPDGKKICKKINNLGLDINPGSTPNAFRKQKGTKTVKKNKSLLTTYIAGRNKIRQGIEDKLVKITLEKNQNLFYISRTYITNAEFVSFLNYLKKIGVANTSIDGHYLFYNSNMIANRGGRIFLNDNQKYAVLTVFGNHPINWVNWLGAALFARWVGMRLIDESEWELVASRYSSIDKQSKPESAANIRHSVGDTTPVRRYKPNNLGIYDMFGNVRTWCRNWHDYSNSETNHLTFMKAVKGGSWNRDIVDIFFKDFKPWLMSSRSIGFRLVKDNQCNLLSSNDFARLVKKITKLLGQGYNSFEELNYITRKISVLL